MFDSVTPWTVAHQAPLSMGFPRQEYWSGLPFPTPVDLPNSRIKPASLTSPALAFTTSTSWEALKVLLPPCKEGGHVVVRMHTWFKGCREDTGPWHPSLTGIGQPAPGQASRNSRMPVDLPTVRSMICHSLCKQPLGESNPQKLCSL